MAHVNHALLETIVARLTCCVPANMKYSLDDILTSNSCTSGEVLWMVYEAMKVCWETPNEGIAVKKRIGTYNI